MDVIPGDLLLGLIASKSVIAISLHILNEYIFKAGIPVATVWPLFLCISALLSFFRLPRSPSKLVEVLYYFNLYRDTLFVFFLFKTSVYTSLCHQCFFRQFWIYVFRYHFSYHFLYYRFSGTRVLRLRVLCSLFTHSVC